MVLKELTVLLKAFKVWVIDTDYSIGYLQGIDIKYRLYSLSFKGNEELNKLFEKLDDGRNIMVTLMMKDNGIKIGDKLKLDMNSGEKLII